ncbi:RNA 2',3'-cyclic phosphodiesterase [Bacteroidota bacterium]
MANLENYYNFTSKYFIMRIFTAINISPNEELLSTLGFLELNLRQDRIRWVNPNNLHITINFLGDVDKRKISQIIDVHKNIFEKQIGFKLRIEDIGLFGSSYQPKVIWLGIKPAENLRSIVSELESQLKIIGFTSDRQNFVPHLTIGRIESLQNKVLFQKVISQYKNKLFQKIFVEKATLYESILISKGAVHNVIREFKLM